jgi:hypothetical protein
VISVRRPNCKYQPYPFIKSISGSDSWEETMEILEIYSQDLTLTSHKELEKSILTSQR